MADQPPGLPANQLLTPQFPVDAAAPPAQNAGIPPAGGNPAALGIQAPPLLRRPSTFFEFYQDLQRDPCQGNYAAIMARFNPAQPNAVPANVLMEQALGTPAHVPQAYLCCSLSRRGVRIYCLHMPTKFVGALDGRTTPWDGQIFAFLGDVVHGMITTVVFPLNAYNITANIRVLGQDQLIQALAQLDANHELLPAVEAANPHSLLSMTRTLMYLPARYVPYFLDANGYSIRQTWDLLLPLLQANDDLANCRPLLEWLRIASHLQAPNNGQPNAAPPVVAVDLIVPPADALLLEHRATALATALPGRAQMGATIETALLTLAQSVAAQTNDVRLAREAKAAEQRQPTLPSAKYRNTIGILMEYLQVNDEATLPELWHQWANSDKRQEYTILKELLDACARIPGSFSTLAPVVTPKLLQDLRTFTFLADSQDDLKTGLHPFVVADGTEEHRRANLELARQYGFLQEGEHGITFSDLQALEAKEVRSVPLTYYDLEKTLGMFGNLLQVVLGAQHDLTAAYRSFWDLLTKSMKNDVQIMVDTTGRIKPAHILRSVQLICHQWFASKRAHIAPRTPPFADILHSISVHAYVLPHLPTALFRLAYPQPHTTRTIQSGSYAGASVITPVSSIVSADGQSVTSGITLNTRYTAQTDRTGTTGGRGTFHANLQPDSTLIQLVPANIKLRDLIGTAAQPLADDNSPLCLSFHFKNGCWSNCARKATHRTLTVSEKQRLADFALAQLPKVKASANPIAPSQPVP